MVAVNPTARELSDNMLADTRICSDIQMFLKALSAESDVFDVESDWLARIRQRRIESFEQFRPLLAADDQPVHPLRLCFEALMALGDDDIIVIDGGDIAAWFETAIGLWAMEGRKIKGYCQSGAVGTNGNRAGICNCREDGLPGFQRRSRNRRRLIWDWHPV